MPGTYGRSTGPAASSNRSLFFNDINDGSAVRQSVGRSIWANSGRGPDDGDDDRQSDQTMGSAALIDPPSSFATYGDRPGSSSSPFVAASLGFAQQTNFDVAPARQRISGSVRNPHAGTFSQLSNGMLNGASNGAPFTRSVLDPTVGSFSQSNGMDLLGAQYSVLPRASSRHRQGSSGFDNVNGIWDGTRGVDNSNAFSRASSQAVSRSNSQAVSRNNSLPPSRHGGDPSPTDQSFNFTAFGGLRGPPYASDRPPSQGQYGAGIGASHFAAPRFGNLPSAQASRAASVLSPDDINGGMSVRNGSVSSRDASTAAISRATEHLSQLNFYEQIRQDRGYGQNGMSQMSHQYYPQQQQQHWQPTTPHARSVAASHAYNGLPSHDFYEAPLPDQHAFSRQSAPRFGLHSAQRHPISPARTYASPQPELASGRNWREQLRPANGQRYIETTAETSLRDVRGSVARFCGDQAGSRFLQDQLEEANTDEKEMVFQELLPNTIQLCNDPFGNYVIQKFFEHGTQRQKEQLARKMKGHVRHLSMNMYGCRCIQKAFEHVLCDQQAELVQELRGCLIEVSKDQQGNHVVQKAIERLRRDDIRFIIHGYYDKVKEMSQDSFGCRVIQRLLEVDDDPELRARLIAEVHKCSLDLIRNAFGNYVVQHVIEHGRPDDRSRLIRAILPIVVELTNNKFASNVVERCLRMGTEAERDALVARIAELDPATGKPRHLKGAMLSSYGNYVIQRIFKTLVSPEWDAWKVLIEGQLDELAAERNSDKKVQEFRRLLSLGPRIPGEPHIDDVNAEKNASAKKSRASAGGAGSQAPRHPRWANAGPPAEDGAEGIAGPPPLTRNHPSPPSSSTPSTSDSAVDAPPTSSKDGAVAASGANYQQPYVHDA